MYIATKIPGDTLPDGTIVPDQYSFQIISTDTDVDGNQYNKITKDNSGMSAMTKDYINNMIASLQSKIDDFNARLDAANLTDSRQTAETQISNYKKQTTLIKKI